MRPDKKTTPIGQLKKQRLGTITSDEILRLLKKYGVILIEFEVLTRFGLTYIISFYHQTFPIEALSTLNDLN